MATTVVDQTLDAADMAELEAQWSVIKDEEREREEREREEKEREEREREERERDKEPNSRSLNARHYKCFSTDSSKPA